MRNARKRQTLYIAVARARPMTGLVDHGFLFMIDKSSRCE